MGILSPEIVRDSDGTRRYLCPLCGNRIGDVFATKSSGGVEIEPGVYVAKRIVCGRCDARIVPLAYTPNP